MKLRSSSNIGNGGRVMNRNSQRIEKINNSLNMNLRSRSIKEKEDEDMEFSTKSTSAKRMRKHREKMRKDECFDIKKYHENERKRISKLRKKQKMKREKDICLLNEYKMKETLRKRE